MGLDLAPVAGRGQAGVDGQAGQDGQPVLLSHGVQMALAENLMLLAAVGALEVAVVLHQTQDGDVHELSHLDRLGDDHAHQVLAVIDGDKATFGTPVVAGAKVDASVVKNGKGKKVLVFKYKPKKGYHKRQGHRQPYTKVTIGKISV